MSFGFADAQAKATYDISPRQRVDLTALAGHSRFVNDPDAQEIDDVHVGLNASVVGVAGWRFTMPRLILSQRVLAADNHFRNQNSSSLELDNGRDRQLAYRADATVVARPWLDVTAGGGGGAPRRQPRAAPPRPPIGSAWCSSTTTRGTDSRPAAHASARWTPLPRLTIAPGVRTDHWTLTDQTTTSPWFQAEWRATSALKVRAGAGVYQQFADFDKVLGVSGGVGLRPERADQYDIGVEQRFGRTVRASMTLYDREEQDMLRRPGAETRVVAGRVVRGSASTKYENRLDGFARGVELMVQRTVSGRGVSGWFSYAFGRNRYHDTVSGETFWGDADQRHTMNAYALYRHSDRASFVAKLRVGSNFPIPGYYASRDGAYFVTDVRNTERLPVYSRLDLRANRAFNWSRRRLTLFAEDRQRAEPRQRALHSAGRQRDDADDVEAVRFDAADRSVGGGSD